MLSLALATGVAFTGVSAAGTASAAPAQPSGSSVLQQLYAGSGFNLEELLNKLQQNGFAWPNYTAKPTATPKPTAAPTATPKPTAAPTATPKPTAAPTATPAPTTAPGSGQEESGTGSFAQQVVTIVNQERAKQGLAALKSDTQLSEVALVKAKDMYTNNYFSHTSPTYGSPFDMMKQFGVTYRYAGENIAKGQRTPAEVMNAWMNSAGHKANILKAEYTNIGVAYHNGVWVQMFKA
ncbi:SCP-like extracellular [Paenibacillus albicereus]|uniref:SCP-like extracellular n=1 Tax=Paenibacillus albicereus TaxID=2726185 RepID=A0A6H2H4D0_9BACL|nr:SCP-like extracellular [Paenibacillus albicereus]